MGFKRKMAVLGMVICLLLGLIGCGGARADRLAWGHVQGKWVGEWSAKAQVHYANQECAVSLKRSPVERFEVIFEGPENLKGLRVTFLPDRTEMCYQGQNLSFSSGRLPEHSVAGQLANVVELIPILDPEQLRLERQDGQLLAQAEGLDLTADLESGNILTLSIPDEELELELLNFQNLA